ncbi:hypothetical protein J3R82DRAFT_2646 [Butyriboletus roseoflavus]|nr:hypothetical protein J3R82DRAFT_2646 [Butyriboletus roseoflavus]
MAATVHIYLHSQLEGASTGTTEHWIRALSIPREDIKRFTLYPLKWVHFATFTVCGAKGDLSATPGGKIVEYDNVSFESLEHKYYYTPNDTYHLTDYQAFNDGITSSVATSRRTNFREDTRRRDNTKAATTLLMLFVTAPVYTNNCHSLLIMMSISTALRMEYFCARIYIKNLAWLQLDSSRLQILPCYPPMFRGLSKDPIPHSRTTLQYHMPPTGSDIVLQRDIRADWSRDELPPPPSILLDFMYGAAVVKHWGCNPLGDVLRKRFEDDFSKVLAENPKHSTPEDDESEVELDDPGNNDPDWKPSKDKQKGRKTFSSDASAGLLEAMDMVLYLSMMVKGTTPELMAAEWEKQNKEREQRSQEHSCEKVQQWLDSDAS